MTAQPRVAPLPVDAIREQVRGDLATCVSMGLGRTDAARLLAFVEDRVHATRTGEYPVTGEHPDFQPDNILVAPGTVTVIDFTSFRHGSAFSDPARFLASLAFLGKHPLYRSGTLDAMAAAFLDGYGWPPERRDPALDLYLVRFMVQAVRTASTWPHPRPVRWMVERGSAWFLARWARRITGSDRLIRR
jgi:Ser/Thr protein kinase RdoA (MazF antagonist)